MHRRFKILIIDDDPYMRETLRLTLEEEGLEALEADGALAGMRASYEHHPDAILLDVMMPEMDGFEACRQLRDMTDVPIIFVTGQATNIDDVVKGFSVGADDYVTKPVNCTELISRLHVCLRRASQRRGEAFEYLSPDASVVLNSDRHELIIENESVYLCPKEFEVLRLLIQNAGKVLNRDTILSEVWGQERIGESELLKQYIYRLRKKIEPNPGSPRYIHSVRGKGYYFEVAGQRALIE